MFGCCSGTYGILCADDATANTSATTVGLSIDSLRSLTSLNDRVDTESTHRSLSSDTPHKPPLLPLQLLPLPHRNRHADALCDGRLLRSSV